MRGPPEVRWFVIGSWHKIERDKIETKFVLGQTENNKGMSS